MEGVEEVNRSAVESCKKLVARLSQSGDPFRPMAVVAKTDEAVARFNKVVTILSNRVGHARVRVGKRSPPPVDPSCFLDHQLVPCPPRTDLHGSSTPAPPPQLKSITPPSRQEKMVAAAPCAAKTTPAAKVDRNMFLETPLLDLNGCSVPSIVSVQKSSKVCAAPAVNPSCTTQIQFQQQQKSFQFDQKPSDKFHIEMPRSSAKEVITLSFDNSVCTSSAAASSFFTSISSQLISMSDAATNSVAASAKKACARKADDSSGKCHCPKKKKPREKRVVRVPAIGDKVSDIPADNYSWRKYGQKPIKGSPHPRGYYRCSSIRDCPARKHVERCRSDPTMMIVTYENEHNHAEPLDLSLLATNAEA